MLCHHARMVLVVAAVAVAVAVGWALGGRVANLAQVRVRGWWLVAAGLIGQLAHQRAGWGGLLLLGQCAPLVFLWRNRLLPGVPTLALGAGLNALVVLASGGMPVSATALRTIGASQDVRGGRHLLLEPGHPFAALSDVIALPVLHSVVSVGDVVVATGAAILVAGLMRAHPRPERRRVHAAVVGSPPSRAGR